MRPVARCNNGIIHASSTQTAATRRREGIPERTNGNAENIPSRLKQIAKNNRIRRRSSSSGNLRLIACSAEPNSPNAKAENNFAGHRFSSGSGTSGSTLVGGRKGLSSVVWRVGVFKTAQSNMSAKRITVANFSMPTTRPSQTARIWHRGK